MDLLPIQHCCSKRLTGHERTLVCDDDGRDRCRRLWPRRSGNPSHVAPWRCNTERASAEVAQTRMQVP
jgi:hypothetical protein